MNSALQKYRYPDWENLLASIGHGALKEGQVVNKLLDEYKKDTAAKLTDEDILKSIEENSKVHVRTTKKDNGIVVKGLHDLSVRFSHCCSPVPGDEVIGYVTRGRGISIHRTDCPNIMALPEYEKERMISAEWSSDIDKTAEGAKYATSIQIFCKNRIGLFADLSRVMMENMVDIQTASSRVNKQGTATIEMSFEVSSVDELQRLVARLRTGPGVVDIQSSAG